LFESNPIVSLVVSQTKGLLQDHPHFMDNPTTTQISDPAHSPDVAKLFLAMGECHAGHTALVSHQLPDGKRRSLTYDALVQKALAVAEGLIEEGLLPGDRVMILADNRLEWMVTSVAVTFAGAIDVPRGNDSTHDEVNYILHHSASRFLVVEGKSQLDRMMRTLEETDLLHRIVVMDDEGLTSDQLANPMLTSLSRLEEIGKKRAPFRLAHERITVIRPDDIYTIIYTSGTTGRPKGVVLSHANMMSQVRQVPITIHRGWKVLSILPIWHSYERAFELIALARGIEMSYASLRSIGADMKEVRPQLMVSAPRLWENVYSRIQHTIRSSGIVKKVLFRTAWGLAYATRTACDIFTDRQLELTPISPAMRAIRKVGAGLVVLLTYLPYRLFDFLVFRKLRAIIGGRFVYTVSGGGALPRDIDCFFNYIGIPVLEGYGMTESSPVLSVRLSEKLVIGTVGPLYPGTTCRIVDPESGKVLYPDDTRSDLGRGLKGEIQVKGPQVMQGYFRSPEDTAKVIQDGWLKTGDLGVMTFNQCLKILGRIKDTVVLLSGENIEPVPIELRLSQSPLIAQCMVVGQDQKYLGLLVVPAVDGFAATDPALNTMEAIQSSQEARNLVQNYIHDCISVRNGFKPFERIHSWRWVPKSFEVGDEMTSTFKLKRHVITARYGSLIDSMYAQESRKG
jgi:long-chain acyl-CoA synthetase